MFVRVKVCNATERCHNSGLVLIFAARAKMNCYYIASAEGASEENFESFFEMYSPIRIPKMDRNTSKNTTTFRIIDEAALH